MTIREVTLSTTPTPEALAALRLGDVVYLDGLMYTAREGVYMRALEDRAVCQVAAGVDGEDRCQIDCWQGRHVVEGLQRVLRAEWGRLFVYGWLWHRGIVGAWC